ncbi:hypothetical protein HDC90_004613 [Pedobacter sp. AK013]|nr:hypothetical protein [Pedobacter sp. AK013]
MKKNILYTFLCIQISLTFAMAQGVPADSLIKAYRQDTANNCASIALIKANLNVFGLDGLYTQRKLSDSTTEFTLKDKRKITLSKRETELARSHFRVDTSDAKSPYLHEVIATSQICYAIMAKTFSDEFPQLSKKSFDKDLDYITQTSFDIRFGTNLLGTGDYTIIMKRYASIYGKKGAVVWSPHHTVFANNTTCDMPGNSSVFKKWTKSYIRFWGRMYIDPELTTVPEKYLREAGSSK